MRGRGVETGLIVEAACQKFFESTATYRMERRLANSNINLSRQAIGQNLVHLSGFLRPVHPSDPGSMLEALTAQVGIFTSLLFKTAFLREETCLRGALRVSPRCIPRPNRQPCALPC